MGRIDYWHTELPAMGSRKIAAKLREEGYQVGRKLARSYMREMAIYAVYPKPNLSKNDGKAGIVPYLLRYKTAIFPNQYWSVEVIHQQVRQVQGEASGGCFHRSGTYTLI